MIQNDFGCGLMMADGQYCSSLGDAPHLCSNCQLRLLNEIRYGNLSELLDMHGVPSKNGTLTLTTRGRILHLLNQRSRFLRFAGSMLFLGLTVGSVFMFCVFALVLYILP